MPRFNFFCRPSKSVCRSCVTCAVYRSVQQQQDVASCCVSYVAARVLRCEPRQGRNRGCSACLWHSNVRSMRKTRRPTPFSGLLHTGTPTYKTLSNHPPPQGCNFFAVNYMLTRDALFTVYTKPFRPVHMVPFRPLSGFSRSVFRRTIGLGPAPVNR